MGLDAVELMMDVEDHFGITLLHDETASIRTVGDLVALVRKRVEAASTGRCFSLPAFLSLRKLVHEIAGDNRMRIRPRDYVVDILTCAQRKMLWRRLPELIGDIPESLRRPKAIRILLVCCTLFLFAAAFYRASVEWAVLPLTLFIAIVLVFALGVATTAFQVVPTDNMATFGDITRKIVSREACTVNIHLPDDAAILNELKPIIANLLKVDPSNIVMNARLVEDLGMS